MGNITIKSANTPSVHHDLVIIDRDVQSVNATARVIAKQSTSTKKSVEQPQRDSVPYLGMIALVVVVACVLLRKRAKAELNRAYDAISFVAAITLFAATLHAGLALSANDSFVVAGAVMLALATYWLVAETRVTSTQTASLVQYTHELANKTETLANRTGTLAEETSSLAKSTADGLAQSEMHHQEALMPVVVLDDLQFTLAPEINAVTNRVTTRVSLAVSGDLKNIGVGPALNITISCTVGSYVSEAIRLGSLGPGQNRIIDEQEYLGDDVDCNSYPHFILNYESVFQDKNGQRSAGTTRLFRHDGIYKSEVFLPSRVQRPPDAGNGTALVTGH